METDHFARCVGNACWFASIGGKYAVKKAGGAVPPGSQSQKAVKHESFSLGCVSQAFSDVTLFLYQSQFSSFTLLFCIQTFFSTMGHWPEVDQLLFLFIARPLTELS